MSRSEILWLVLALLNALYVGIKIGEYRLKKKFLATVRGNDEDIIDDYEDEQCISAVTDTSRDEREMN